MSASCISMIVAEGKVMKDMKVTESYNTNFHVMNVEYVSKSQVKYSERMQHEVPCDECGSACQQVFMPRGHDIREDIRKLIRENDNLKLTIEDQNKAIRDLEKILDNARENLGKYIEKNEAMAASNRDLQNKLQASVSDLDRCNDAKELKTTAVEESGNDEEKLGDDEEEV